MRILLTGAAGFIGFHTAKALLARELNPDVLIIARGEDSAAERRLLRAGADRVVSPYQIGGRRMAHSVLRPRVMDFIDRALILTFRTRIHEQAPTT